MGDIMSNNKFLDLIEKQRKEKKREKFKGTFMEYLDLVEKEPNVADLAHRRLYKSISEVGTKKVDEGDTRYSSFFEKENTKIYNYFSDHFFGNEKVISKFMRYLKSAAAKGEESRQVLLLMGPVGAGKSALVDHIKRSMESKPVYAIEGCPINEEPLHLLPRSLRPRFEEILGVKIEGDLCPICRHRLMEEFNGEYEKMNVVEKSISIRGRRGIAVVPPVDANTQDTSMLVGVQDISKLDLYSEDDPRTLTLNGAFNKGNRGIVEFVEVFKNEIEFLHTIITATQEKAVPSPGSNAMIYFDGVILSHCNEAEWNRFKSEHTNEAILDRIVKIDVPYSLEVDQEIKIYKKMIGMSDFRDVHIAPHTLKVAAMFAVMSRMEESQKCDLLTKMKIYNGEEVIERGRVKKIDVKDLREEFEREGMKGISTRFIMKSIDAALSDSENDTITPISMLKALKNQVKDQITDIDFRNRCMDIIQKMVRDEYLKILENEIAKAFISAYEEQAKSIFDSYLDNAEAYTTSGTVRNKITKEERRPDERFMKSIESAIGISGSSKDGFRSDVTAYMFAKMRKGENVDYTTYAPLKDAIESYLISSVKDIARIVTKSKTRDDDQRKRYSEMMRVLIEDYGYNENSAEEVITYASNNIWRDS
jgi:serine protein kinase